MSTIVSLRIETWGDKFVVMGEFNRYTSVPRREYETYSEALKELARVAQREELRHEHNLSRGLDR